MVEEARRDICGESRVRKQEKGGGGGGAQCNLAEHSRESYDLNLAAAGWGGGRGGISSVKAFVPRKKVKV
jgi:hypothetical protein